MVNRLIKQIIDAFAEYAGAWPFAPDEPPVSGAKNHGGGKSIWVDQTKGGCDFDMTRPELRSSAAVPACRLVYSADRKL